MKKERRQHSLNRTFYSDYIGLDDNPGKLCILSTGLSMKFWSIDTCCFINHVYIAQNVIDGPQYNYTQYPIIRNGLIRNSAEFLGKFKKRALSRSNLRNASKNLRNGQCSNFQS